MWIKPTGSFEVKPISGGWGNAWPVVEPSWRDDPEKKKRFAKLLSKYSAFDAACIIFGTDTNAALWVSHNWINDPVVLEVQETVDIDRNILDKDALCHRLLSLADEKSPQGHSTIETKDRIAAFKLYAEIQGYIGKNEAPTFNNFANNNIKVTFVKPEEQQKLKIIEHETNNALNDNSEQFKPLKLKIV